MVHTGRQANPLTVCWQVNPTQHPSTALHVVPRGVQPEELDAEPEVDVEDVVELVEEAAVELDEAEAAEEADDELEELAPLLAAVELDEETASVVGGPPPPLPSVLVDAAPPSP